VGIHQNESSNSSEFVYLGDKETNLKTQACNYDAVGNIPITNNPLT